jgi:hypothetical protein
MSHAWRWGVAGWLLVPMLGACAAGAAPFEDLPLRDALSADPEVILGLSIDARRRLAERLLEAQQTATPAEAMEQTPLGTPADEVRQLDTSREARGEDALVLGLLEPRAEGLAVRPLELDKDFPSAASLPWIEGRSAGETAETEEQALDGRAGEILAQLVERSGARRVVRVVGWPVGAVARGDAVYVNASYLIALDALDPTDPRPPRRALSPPMHLRSLRGSPYLLYPSVEACATDVERRCEGCLVSGACDETPILTDFKSQKSECQFLSQEPTFPLELCALALLSIESVAGCVRDKDPRCIAPSGSTRKSLDGARKFLSNDACRQVLNVCLGAAQESSSSSGSGGGGGSEGGDAFNVQTSSCQDPFSACASSCKGFGNGCKTGSCTGTNTGSSCSSCNSSNCSSSSCSSCKSCSSSSGSGSSCGKSGGNCKCEAQPRSPAGPTSPASPLGAVVWLLAPLGYVLLRTRRAT